MTSYTLPNRFSIHPTHSFRATPNAISMTITYLAVIGTQVDGGGIFHFRLSLVSQAENGREAAVRIDMVPYSNTTYGVALVEYTPYGFSRNFGPRPYTVPVGEGITAGLLLYLIFDRHKLDKYVFVHPGVGCRHWCASVLDKLAGDGVINGNVTQDFEIYENEQHAELQGTFPMPRIKGAFYP